ncbi:hypothetical protein [Parasitella parasitica]|uniref:Uncharacterized protein n=1 Tax=Parasitella parasitica TaxID=35722 RepID=A0A0B7NS23_9FUNG|nr:hypothetical protein [Parasitella parasitica]
MSSNKPHIASSGNMSTTSFSNKSCYRLYAGHGNWINLNAKTTQDLLRIFEKGEPCRYQLAAGLFIDIIPNDVDCNSKNIDMVGLMRADLVYEPQMMENHVQQAMSHYVRSLLDEQGIIDAFPPLRQGEDLPIITSIPPHRHLSLVPSVVGTVRRGPKSSAVSNPQRKSSSSSSSVTVTDDDHLALSCSSNSSTTHDSAITNVNATRKRATNNSSSTPRRSHLKRNRENSTANIDSIELISHQPKRQMMSLELPNLNSASTVFTANNALTPISMSPFIDHNNNATTNGNNGVLGFHHHHHNNSHFQQQQMQHHNSTHLWLPSYQTSPTQTSARSSFNFEFGIDFDHALQQPSSQHQEQQQQQKQSPTDILHEYDTSGFTHQMMTNGHDLYSNNTTVAAVAAATNMQHSSQLLNDNHHHMMTTAASSDTTSLESFVPASPIPASWLESNHHLHHQHQPRDDGNWHQHHYPPSSSTALSSAAQNQYKTALTTAPLDASVSKIKSEFGKSTSVPSGLGTNSGTSVGANVGTGTGTTADMTPAALPTIDLLGNSDTKNHQAFLAHADALSSSSTSPSSTSSSPAATC